MKITIFCFLALFIYSGGLLAQAVSINTDAGNPDPSAILDVKSTDKGMLVPRMSTGQRNLIAAPATGLLVFDTTTGGFWFFNGTAWISLSGGSGSYAAGPGISIVGSTITNTGDTNASNDITIGSTAGGSLFGTYPNPTIATGAVGTVELANNSITSSKIADGAVTGDDIAPATIAAVNLATNSITTAKINDDAITSIKIADGTITSADIANGTITAADLGQMGASAGQMLKWNGTTWTAADDFMGGDNWGAQVVITSSALSGNGTPGSPLTIAPQGASSGQILKWNGATWLPADDNNWGGDNWGTQTATTNAAITGDGTVGNPLDIAAQGATAGQVLKFNGTNWVPQDEAGGDGWGNQTATTSFNIVGDGTTGNPLRLDPLGATNGQVLKFNGTTWAPQDESGGDDWGNQAAATSFNIVGDGTTGNPLRFANFSATVGQVLSWNPTLNIWVPADDTWGTQTVITGAALSGNGTGSSPLDLDPQGAATGQVLKFNGTAWTPANDNAGADNWGAQVAVTNATLTGNGTAANPLNIAQQGATIGQILKWNGVAWTPASNSNTLLQDTDGNTRVQVEKNANEDIIRFDLGGTETMVLRKNASGMTRLELTDTSGNTFVGQDAGYFNTFGNNNTAHGFESLYSNTTGEFNTANGAYALYSNTTGSLNTANGSIALYSNTTGVLNTANGQAALNLNTTGEFNTANGARALPSNTTGFGNSANGVDALHSNTTGSYNTANGLNALLSNTTGNNNTAIGFEADVTNGNLNNATAIGYLASVNDSNKVRIGNSAVTLIEGQVDWTFPSDARFKYNVHDDMVPGLAFIKQLRPVTYQFDARKFDEHVMQNMPDSIQQQRLSQSTFVRESAPVQTGFLAQEVERACRDLNFTFSGLHVPENNTDNYGLAYASFVPLLVKAIQEQQEQINAQQTENAQLRQQLNQIQSTFEARLLALEKARIEVTPAHASPEK